MSTRIERRFAKLKERGEAGFVAFVTGGDPDIETSLEIIKGLPTAGADVIEVGMPFTDPMADGPAIQEAGLRALKAGGRMTVTLDLVKRFREDDQDTPVVLMGYYNPIYHYGVDAFLRDAASAGVDGLIIVDLPPEEDDELCLPARAAGLNFIRLATPTTDEHRLPAVLANTSGFLYYVAIAGITGTGSADIGKLEREVAAIRASTDLPIAVGFGIKTPENAAEIGAFADAVVVGSALVQCVADNLDGEGRPKAGLVKEVHDKVAALAQAAHQARKTAPAGEKTGGSVQGSSV